MKNISPDTMRERIARSHLNSFEFSDLYNMPDDTIRALYKLIVMQGDTRLDRKYRFFITEIIDNLQWGSAEFMRRIEAAQTTGFFDGYKNAQDYELDDMWNDWGDDDDVANAS